MTKLITNNNCKFTNNFNTSKFCKLFNLFNLNYEIN